MTLLSRLSSFLNQVFRICLVAFVLLCLLLSNPSLAEEPVKAPIVVDGRKILEVSESGGYSALKRATEASRILEEEIETAENGISITINDTGDIPVIEIGEDEKYLLSVTSEDAPTGRSLEAQAIFWAQQIEEAVNRAQYERTIGYLTQATLLSIGLVLLALGISWGLRFIWDRWLEPILARDEAEEISVSESRATLSAQIGAQIIITIVRGFVWFLVIIRISRLFPQTRQISRSLTDSLFSSFTAELIPLGENAYSVLDLFILIALFSGLIIVARTIRKILRSRVLRFTGLNRSAQETVSVIFNYIFLFIGALVVLQLWGLDISSLTVFAGVLGVGIGLGLQGIAKEFLSGLVLIFERPIQVGDFVEVDDLMGTVERISVRSTEIHTLDDVSIILPNSRFLEGNVINWNHTNSVSRLRIPVGVAYGSDTEAVRQVLLNATKGHPDIVSTPAPKVFFSEFGESSLNFNLLVWVREPRKQFQVKSDLYFKIEALMRDRKIQLPFPQRDIHVRSGDLPITLSPELVASLAQLSNNLSGWLHSQSNGGVKKQ